MLNVACVLSLLLAVEGVPEVHSSVLRSAGAVRE